MSKQKTLLLAFLALFILPVALAQMAFMGGWLAGSPTVNKGELINPPLSAAALFANNHHWRLVYVMPPICHQACHESLYILGQTHLALGREMDRVVPVVLGAATLPADTAPGLVQGGPGGAPLQPNRLYIADPRGFVMLSYPPASERPQTLALGKDMLTDLKRLLKHSQVG